MARPPAQVRFPGDKNRKQRVKVRGIKQASKEIQKRLERNLEKLLEDPEVILPTIDAELGALEGPYGIHSAIDRHRFSEAVQQKVAIEENGEATGGRSLQGSRWLSTCCL